MSKKKKILIIVGIILLAFIVRIPFLSKMGLGYDMGYWFGWAKSIKDFGLTNVYEQFYTDYVNYPPLMMYYLWGIGKLYSFLGGTWENSTELYHVIVKSLGVFFDVFISLFTYYIARKEFKLSFKKSLVFFAISLFNPIMFYNSSYWGQVDVVHSLFMLVCIYLLSKNKFKYLWPIFGFSILFKLQVIAILPLIGFVTFYKEGLLKTVKYLLMMIGAFLLGMIIYIVAGKLFIVIDMYRDLYTNNAWAFEFGAFNPWWIVSHHNLAEGVFTVEDIKNPVNAAFLGYILILLFTNFKRLKGVRLYFLSAMLTFAFFMFPVGVHERYLFPFFPFLLIFAMKNKKAIYVYIFASIIFLLCMIQTLKPWFFEEFFNSLFETSLLGTVLSIVNILLFGFLSYFVFRGAKKFKIKELFRLKGEVLEDKLRMKN
jgi:Gpi18-like mannosyltransferase